MLDQLSVLKLVTARLEAAGIPYMMSGSIAAGHYAQPRFTRDIDLVMELQPGQGVGVMQVACELDCDVAFVARRRLEAPGLVTSGAAPAAMIHSAHDRRPPR